MAKGNWSFLHEWVIYEYFFARFSEGTLRLKKVVESGRLLGRTRWAKVIFLSQTSGTAFPDINKIQFKGQNYSRPAEVKFTTSLFDYHRTLKHSNQFKEFVVNRGCIIVAGHDHLPVNGLLDAHPELDVFEIEFDDFVSYCRENFVRLLNRQIKAHSQSRVWILYQGPNFNIGSTRIKPARESMIWCPTENLSGLDLAVGDRVLFFKTRGVGRIELQNLFQRTGTIDSRWTLQQLWMGEVKSKVYSRLEFSQYKGFTEDRQLWVNDPKVNGKWRWNRVFEFSKVGEITRDINLQEIREISGAKNFVQMLWEAFCYGKSREISQQDYRNTLELISSYSSAT